MDVTPATERAAAADPALLRAARGLPVDRTPVWFMRQAGRSLPEYRALRAGTAMLEACQDADLVTEITLQPVRRHGVDAAILFSDIVLPLVVAGVDLEIKPGVGPVVASPVRTVADVDALPDLEPERLEFLATAVRRLVAELGETPLIGFAGAPFTLATYLIEGGPSKEHARTKAFMYAEPEAWSRLLDRLAVSAATFLRTQVDAGASAVQLFDSWAGVLSAADYAERVLPHSRAVFDGLGAGDVPRIHFGVGTGELLPLIGDAGADVVGVDWRVALGEGGPRVGPGRSLQGNLDPAVLLADRATVDREVRRVVEQGRAARGHIFNLGHGVLPETDPGALTHVAELVHELSGPCPRSAPPPLRLRPAPPPRRPVASSSSVPGSPASPRPSSGAGGGPMTRSSSWRPATGSAASCTGWSWPGTGTTPAPRRCSPASRRPSISSRRWAWGTGWSRPRPRRRQSCCPTGGTPCRPERCSPCRRRPTGSRGSCPRRAWPGCGRRPICRR